MAAARRGPLLGLSLAVCKMGCGSGSSDVGRIAVWMLVKPPGGFWAAAQALRNPV